MRSDKPRTLVTGANGFVGGALMNALTSAGLDPRGVARKRNAERGWIVVPSIDAATNWDDAVRGVDCVVHLAARVHVMHESSADPLAECRRINVDGTLNLARQAARRGVRRFLFVSSVKVNGEATEEEAPFHADDPPNPSDPYGISKHEAERGLRSIAAETGMEVVIIRPVLVYGPGVKGNFLSLLKWVHSGVPLPLGASKNRRSLVSLDNLVDLIVTCLRHPAAANQTFLVSDGEDVSTADLLRRTANAMGKKARLIRVPIAVMQAGASLFGRGDIALRLFQSLQVDIAKTRELLHWSPPATLDQSLRNTVRDFLANQAR